MKPYLQGVFDLYTGLGSSNKSGGTGLQFNSQEVQDLLKDLNQ
jgi:hypothetical protein